jgi:hypothetical protein
MCAAQFGKFTTLVNFWWLFMKRAFIVLSLVNSLLPPSTFCVLSKYEYSYYIHKWNVWRGSQLRKPLDLYRFSISVFSLRRQRRLTRPASTCDCYLHCSTLTDVKKCRKFRDLWSGGKSKALSRLFERGKKKQGGVTKDFCFSHENLLQGNLPQAPIHECM